MDKFEMKKALSLLICIIFTGISLAHTSEKHPQNYPAITLQETAVSGIFAELKDGQPVLTHAIHSDRPEMPKLLAGAGIALNSTAMLKAAQSNVKVFQLASPNMEFLDLTDEEALELGMTEITGKRFIAVNSEGLALNKTNIPDSEKAQMVIIVNKARQGTSPDAQTMKVYYQGVLEHTFKVSTAREKEVTTKSGKKYMASTPVGYFRPTKIYKEYYSSLWAGSPMHHAVFFIGGIAIHATTPKNFHKIGKRASGGCIRLMPKDAQALNEMVLMTGRQDWYLAAEIIVASNNKRYVRKRAEKWQMSVPKIARHTGTLDKNTAAWSLDTLIIVK
ncbi:L,D-transpeptidase [Elusimicrobiota bacterium]